VVNQIIGLPGQTGLLRCRSRTRLVMVSGRFEVRYNSNIAGLAEVGIVHTQHFNQDYLMQVVRLVECGSILLNPVIRDVVPIWDAVQVFNTLRDNPSRLLGTVFVFNAAIT
jgi:threonine dehydrogenase-like Zn-dependent dehydrogenase